MKNILARFDLRLTYWEIGLVVILLSAITLGAGLLALDFAPARQPAEIPDIATPTAPRVNAIAAPDIQPTATPRTLPNVTAPRPIIKTIPPATSAPNTSAPSSHPPFAPGQTCQACHDQLRGGKK